MALKCHAEATNDTQQESININHCPSQHTDYVKVSPKLQEGNDTQALPSPDPATEGQIMGFHPEEQVRATFKKCLQQGHVA